MHRCGPEIFPQKIHPVAGKAPVCKDTFTRMSVTASYGVEARRPRQFTKQPGHKQSIPQWGGGEVPACPSHWHQQSPEKEETEASGGPSCEERNKLTCRVVRVSHSHSGKNQG